MILPGLAQNALKRPSKAAPTAFTAGNVSYPSVAALGRAMALAAGTYAGNATAGGTLTIDGKSLGSYDYAIKSGNQTVSSFTLSNWFTTTQDSRAAFVAVDGNLTINSGITFTPSVRKLFTVIYVKGDLVVNGTISMTARGANHSASGSNITAQDIKCDVQAYSGGVTDPIIPAAGAAGGVAVGPAGGAQGNYVNGNNGGAGANGQSGGGASGGTTEGATSGAGAAGTSFSGGPAGGGSRYFTTAPSGAANGGAGGNAALGSGVGNRSASGGAGNPGGSNAIGGSGGSYYAADSGTGGTLIIIVEGTISGTGIIESKGSRGGSVNYGGAGGGSGGGAVTIICGTDAATYTLDTSGGQAGYGGNNVPGNGQGGTGGAGHGRKLTGYYW